MNNEQLEKLLIDRGVFERKSHTRRVILGCIGCRWSAMKENDVEPSFHGYQAVSCSGISPGSVYPVLDRLEQAGVVTSELEDMGEGLHGRPPRKIYHPTPSGLGLEFADMALTQTNLCSLRSE